MYLVNLAGNSLIIMVTWTDPKLQTPMYFLLSQLSCVDMAFASNTIPQFLVHTFFKHNAIPYDSCFVQMTFSLAAGNMEGYVLATMAYNRYMAICRPLHYVAVMTQLLCVCIVAGSWVLVTLLGSPHAIQLSLASYCNNCNLLVFCDIPFLVSIDCPKPFLNDLVLFTEGISVIISPLLFILASFACIRAAVLSLRLAARLRKTMSTCGSHVLVVMLFFGKVIHLCFQPPRPLQPGTGPSHCHLLHGGIARAVLAHLQPVESQYPGSYAQAYEKGPSGAQIMDETLIRPTPPSPNPPCPPTT
ncbi:olfactory receptor 1361-like [Tachyglossus aculeatus]|uniref:olfactory receptor 1361-like n=1 Tax=Tachyglossus aculeatus TaxID=9261 RepID=UPI0018F54B86|nr:olfactory receptor 1361-like [Tachyglossus aculeatus]